MELTPFYDEIARCNKCGFCQVACPVFRSTGEETGVARGRIALLRALIENRMPWSRELEEPLFNCLLCGACTSNCFPAVATADLLLAARSEYVERVHRKSVHKLLFDHLLPYPGRLKLAVRALAAGKKSGASKVAGALGLLRFLGRDVARAEPIVERFPNRALRDDVPPGVMQGRGTLRAGYFVGCGIDLVEPEAGHASLHALLELFASVEVLDNCCCGLPAVTYGDRNAARSLARRNLAPLSDKNFDIIVTDCSSCAAFLKKYPTLFADGEPERARAADMAGRVKDLVQILPAKPPAPTPAHTGNSRISVTWHDPCHAKRGQKIAREPRDLLRSLPGVEYREMPESDWCCGGAGSYALAHYDLSWKVLQRKIDNIEKTKADVVATSCPACVIHLSYGVRMRGLPVRVQHISQIAEPT